LIMLQMAAMKFVGWIGGTQRLLETCFSSVMHALCCAWICSWSSRNCLRRTSLWGFGGGGKGSTSSFKRSKPLVLCIAVRSAASNMISLRTKKGKPSINGEHRLGAIMARREREVQRRFREDRDKVT
jgi:hypothetical protein